MFLIRNDILNSTHLYRYELFEDGELVGGFIQDLELFLEREDRQEYLEHFNTSLPLPQIPKEFKGEVSFYFTEFGVEQFKYLVDDLNNYLLELFEGYIEIREKVIPANVEYDHIIYYDDYQVALLDESD